jgi:hypothetical protein
MRKTTRRRRLLWGWALFAPFLAIISSSAGGQERTLIEAARREGKVTIFGPFKTR